MNKRWLHSVWVITVNLVFTLAFLSKSLHFLLVPHEFTFYCYEDTPVFLPKKEIHFCDFQFIKTLFKYSNEIIVGSVFEKIIQKKLVVFPERELAGEIKYSFRLRGPPEVYTKYRNPI